MPLQHPPDDQARAGTGVPGILADPHDSAGELPLRELAPQFLLIEVLVEPDRDDGRPELPDRLEHVMEVPEDCPVNRF